MQTPAGFRIEGVGDEAHAVITNFWEMVFNPSSLDRLTHTIIGCWLAGAFLIISVAAFYFLKKRHFDFAKASMKVGLGMAIVSVCLQLFSGDDTAQGVAVNQPTKLAALEGVYQTVPRTPITLFGWVDSETQTVHGVQIPGLLSLLTNRDLNTPVRGLDQFPQADWPKVAAVFQTYHLMVMMWGLMVLGAVGGIWLWRKGKLFHAKWFLRYLVISVLFPQIANEAGWFTAELGRQPWIVYGLMRTSEGLSRKIHAGQVFSSITIFLAIYILLFILFIYLLNHKIKQGPQDVADEERVFSDRVLQGGTR